MSETSGRGKGRRGGGGRGRNSGGRGRSGRGGRSSNKKKQQQQAPPKKDPEEEKKREEEARQKALEEEAERKRLEEERAVKSAQLARQKAQDDLDKRARDAIDHLKAAVDGARIHKENRLKLQPEALAQSRKDFEANKKNLKSDMKKCTAFVKKIKSGGAWSMKPEEITRDVSTLNLSRYVEEVVAALLESKFKLGDMPVVLALCTSMHLRYAAFYPNLVTGLWTVINAKPTEETAKLRRLYVRLITEFLLYGLSQEPKPLVKLLAEATGGKDGSYVVTDANLVLAFCKTGGFEVFGVRPKSLQADMAFLRDALEARKSVTPESSSDGAPLVISEKLATDAVPMLEQVEEALKELAVSDEVSGVMSKHCMGAYRTLSTTLVSTHTKLQKLEKRCDQDRLLAGSLSETREKGLNDARKLFESIQKSVEALSDVLDQTVPQLQEEENDGDAEGSGIGVELWTKTGGEEAGDFGPFDDEETRSFYCDIPDLLTTVPPALLGLSPEEIEERKGQNLQKYGFGSDSTEEEEEAEGSAEVDPITEDQLEEEEEEGSELTPGEDGNAEEGEEGDEGSKDTPHYRLMVLIDQELPECSRREQIDEITEKFCINHGLTKNSRKRLSKALFMVPRSRLDLLPYYSRMAASLDRVWSDIASPLVTGLEQQFHGQAKFKKNQNIESRMKTARFIGELTKFRVAPPIISLRCLQRCLEDFNGGNVDVACCLLESCGRYLYRMKHTTVRLTKLMDTMMRIAKAKHFDERAQALINTAFYTVKPPASAPRKQAKVYPPLEAYLRNLLMVRLNSSEESVSFVCKQLIRFPWSDPVKQCGPLVCRYMLKTCRKGRYMSIKAVSLVAAGLRRHKPEVPVRLVDALLEELQWAMEHPNFRDQQRTLSYARLLGEVFCESLVSAPLIIQQLYRFINFGHEIPEALRAASEEVSAAEGSDKNEQDALPVYNSASGIAHTIQEEEEVEDAPLETNKEKEVIQPVAVSRHSKFDPRVPSPLDPPNSVFRIKLVCTLLEVVARLVMTRNNLPKMEAYLTAFQRYLFTKTLLPTEVEFSLLDTFDILDSQWRKAMKEVSGKKRGEAEDVNELGFPRFRTWFDAHNATVAFEEADSLLEARTRNRLESLAGKSDGDDVTDLLNEDDIIDDYDEESINGESFGGKDSYVDDEIESDVETEDEDEEEEEAEEESGSDVSEDESEDESEEDTDDEGSEDEFDEAAYMQQLEEEAFERELRRLTKEALDKGKVAARSAGGKVADTMISGSQFIKKKPVDSTGAVEGVDGPTTALGGKEGITFQLLKKGNKGKVVAKNLVVPTDTNLAKVATKQDDEAARERDMIKARVLQYEAESAESEFQGGNVYLEQEKLQVIRNRPLSMEEIDRNFGTSGGNLRQASDRQRSQGSSDGRGGGRGQEGRGSNGRDGRGSGRGRSGRGRGRGSASGRSLWS